MIDLKFGDWVKHEAKGEAVVIGVDAGRVLVAFKRNSQSPLLESFAIATAHEWLTPLDPEITRLRASLASAEAELTRWQDWALEMREANEKAMDAT